MLNIDLIRLLEILLYELIDLFPNLILASVPFVSFLRSRKRFIPLIALLYLLLSISRVVGMYNLTAAVIVTVIWIFFYLIFYLVSFRVRIEKLLFVLLILLNYGSFVAVLFSYFVYHRFPAASDRPYSFSASLMLAAVYFISYPAVFYMMHHKIKPLMEAPENNRYWRFLWLVPATFCLSYYYNLYANGGIVAFSEHLSNVCFAVFFNLGALFVTYLLARLMTESNANMQLKQENYFLNMKSLQYENLQGRIEEAKRARHDLRQTLALIQSYLNDGNIKELLAYLQQYTKTLPSDTPIAYCENYAVNALIVYYATIAKQHGILFSAETEYPADSGIADSDAVVLLGNLMENAVEACARLKKADTSIFLHIKTFNAMLVITLDNSCGDDIQKSGDGFKSSKTGRSGIGTSSIQQIAEKYHGTVKYEYGDHLFHASVLLTGPSGPN